MTWIQTYTGRAFDFDAAMRGQAQPIVLEDIAWPLARTCRFTGHVRTHVSVAEHSVIVMHLAARRPEIARLSGKDKANALRRALFHDAHEAYTGDVSRPLKILARRRGLTLLDELEGTVQRQIEDRFGIDAGDIHVGYAIKHADNEALSAEKAHVLGRGPRDREWQWLPPTPGLAFAPGGLSPSGAYAVFVAESARLGIHV